MQMTDSNLSSNTVNMKHSITGSSDKVFYYPGEIVHFFLFVENHSNNPIKLSNFEIIFDFGTIVSNLEIIIPIANSKTNGFSFRIPNSIQGNKKFRLQYDLYSYDATGIFLKKFGLIEDKYFIKIISQREINTTRYIAFVSRGLSEEDRIVGDTISNRIRQWNFEPKTVGIEVSASDRHASSIIRNEIRMADILFAIATPRNYDYVYKTWRTLEWLQAEVGIAYGINKPLILIQEESVALTALPKYLTDYGDIPWIKYKRGQINRILGILDSYMPYFREAIKKDKVNEFFSNCFKIGVLGLASIKAIEMITNAFDGFNSKN